MLIDFKQPAKDWLADAVQNFGNLLEDGEDPSFTITVNGSVIEIRLSKVPGVFERISGDLDEQKATAYYKAGMLKQAPPWVPATVRVLREQFGDHPFRGAGVAAGDHECHCNKWGAVSVTDRAGNRLGLRLDEFEPLTWRENEVPS